MIKKWAICVLLCFISAQCIYAQTNNPNNDPAAAKALVEQQSQVLLQTLNADPERYRNDPAAFTQLIRDEVLPYMDFKTMSRIVLGKYWKQTTPAQQDAFVAAFRDLLIRLYSRGWTQYADAEVTVLNHTGLDKYNRTNVSVRIKPSGKPNTMVIFSLSPQNGQWKIYDVSFENVSIVLSYRNSFAEDIEKLGIDGLITKIHHMDGNE